MRALRLWIWPAFATIAVIATYSCGGRVGGGPGLLAPVPSSLSLALFAQVPSTVTAMISAPGDTSRLFVVEQPGVIRIVKHHVLLARPFLDLSSQTQFGGEDGLLGLAFASDYSTSGIFYVSFTSTSSDLRILRYHVSASNPDSANPNSSSPVFSLPLATQIHHSGDIRFGPDGKLYVGVGDGGPQYDANHTGQDRSDLFASILRLNVASTGAYTVPSDNPWVGVAGVRSELWSYGLRNPWQFSFDRATGDLYLGDVGQDAWEEIDASPAVGGGGKGANYGWSVLEGRACGPTPGCDSTGKTMPVLAYAHNSGAGECSVIGGYVYRGHAIPGLGGVYFYSDLCGAWLRSFRLIAGAATEKKDWSLTLPDSPSCFGEDANGELYIGTVGGMVLKLMP